MPDAPIHVVHFQRRPQDFNYSIERVFEDIRRALPDGIDARPAVCRFPSRGVWRRIYNIIEAAFRQGDVNHITGDVHYLALLLHKKKTLLTIHDLVSAHRLKGWRKTLVLFFWYWLPIRRAAAVSVISEFTMKDLLQHLNVDSRKVLVIHDPVSDDYQPDVKEFDTVKPVVLQVGAGANKNVERVAEALHGIPCHLRVIGNLNEEQLKALQRYGIEYSYVFDISDAEVVGEYRKCDMLVFASTYEGFGLPILEAQATGRPVVTGNVCSMPEVAADAACLVDPFDVASIRKGILKIIGDPAFRGELVRLGFENVKRFRPQRIAQEYADIYGELPSQ